MEFHLKRLQILVNSVNIKGMNIVQEKGLVARPMKENRILKITSASKLNVDGYIRILLTKV